MKELALASGMFQRLLRLADFNMQHKHEEIRQRLCQFGNSLQANAIDQPEAFPEVDRKKVHEPRKSRTLGKDAAEAGRFSMQHKHEKKFDKLEVCIAFS